MADLPSYDELPVREGLPQGSSWGVWGEEDFFGCLNLAGPEKVLDAARLVRRGAVFALNLGLELPEPPLFGRAALQHEVRGRESGWAQDDEILLWNTQVSSQWDGFRHINHPRYGAYGGLADERHGIHHWARRGIVSRGVLADVALYREKEGSPLRQGKSDPIEPSDVEGALASHAVSVETGDILLIRTGFLSWYRSLDSSARSALAEDQKWPGLRQGRKTAAFLWNLHIAGVAADNPSFEVWPPGALLTSEEMESARQDPDLLPEIFVHLSLLPLLGLPIGELWDIDALAADCAADGVYEFMLASAPLNLSGGVATPPNALAIK